MARCCRRHRGVSAVVVGLLALAGVVAIVVAGRGRRRQARRGARGRVGVRRAPHQRPPTARRHLLDALAPLLAPAPRARGVGRRLRAAALEPGSARAARGRRGRAALPGRLRRALARAPRSSSACGRAAGAAWCSSAATTSSRGSWRRSPARWRSSARDAGHVVPLVAHARPAATGRRSRTCRRSRSRSRRHPARRAGRRSSRRQQLQALGIDMTFAPSADLGAAGGPWPRRARSATTPAS